MTHYKASALCLHFIAMACLGTMSISEASDTDTQLLKYDASIDGPPFQYYLLADNQVTHAS